jgi:arginine-tRNA-protein transferase
VFSLVESIHEPEAAFRPEGSTKHRFEVRQGLHSWQHRFQGNMQITIEPAVYTEEKFELYSDYQYHVHNESNKRPQSFKSFLCDTDLIVCITSSLDKLSKVTVEIPAALVDSLFQNAGHASPQGIWNASSVIVGTLSSWIIKFQLTLVVSRIDGELVAMSVLDILPGCLSGVYFMYKNKWEKCQFGKVWEVFHFLCLVLNWMSIA